MEPSLEARIGRVAYGELVRRGGGISPSISPSGVDDGQLRAILEAHGYVPHEPALEFERTWGGLRFEEFTFGPAACAESQERGGSASPGLIPVVLSDNDVYYFLAADGTGWAQDGIEDPDAVPFAESADQLVALIILYAVTWDRRMHDLVLDLDGPRGAELARLFGLPSILAGPTSVWGNADVLVMERAVFPEAPATTLVATATAELFARVPRQPPGATHSHPSGVGE